MGIDVDQLRRYVVEPTLTYIGFWSRAAENLVVGTAIAESRGEYLHQLGRGPALGLWQMEPVTHDDIWATYLKFRPEVAALVRDLSTPAKITEGAEELVGNLFYGAAMCRIRYRRVSPPLPEEHDAQGMADYWKRWYNTKIGDGDAASAVEFFERVCGDA